MKNYNNFINNIPFFEINQSIKNYIDSLTKHSKKYQELLSNVNSMLPKNIYKEFAINQINIPKVSNVINIYDEVRETIDSMLLSKEIMEKYNFAKIVADLTQNIHKQIPNNLDNIINIIKSYQNFNFSEVYLTFNNDNFVLNGEIVQEYEIEEEISNIMNKPEFPQWLYEYEEFNKLSPVKRIIIKFIYNIVLPILLGIYSNYTYDCFNKNHKYKIIKTINNIIINNITINNITINNINNIIKIKKLRIVTANKLNVRKLNTKKSQIKDQINFGKVVKIIDKKRNWSYIEYKDNTGDIKRGWVFTRYLKKINY